MKNTITAILAAALTLTLLTSCGSVDKSADVTVTTTNEAWQPALITAASVTTAERQTSSTFTEKSTTTTKAVTTTKKTTTKKKTTTSKATTTTKATTTAPITTTTAAPRTTTTAATTTKKATTTTKVTTAKPKPTTTTAVAAKLTQADIDRLVKEAQAYSNSKSVAVQKEWKEYSGYGTAYTDLEGCYKWLAEDLDLSNSSWGTPYTAKTWRTYDEVLNSVKGATLTMYERVPDAHIVIYSEWHPEGCMNSDGEPAWEIYCLY